jgi:flagellar hook assembly protein FlgD
MRQQHVNLSIYNMRGQKIKTLVDEIRAAGRHSIHWNGHDEFGTTLPSGIYVYSMTVQDQRQSRKMVLMQLISNSFHL